MFAQIFIGQVSRHLSPSVDWPLPEEIIYPTKGVEHHDLDYLYLDVANWEEYCAGNSKQTNTEIPARLTYYTAANEFVFSSNVGIRLSGIFIRKLPQKSIAVDFSGKKYGSKKVYYEMFPTRDYDKVRSFVIRAHGNPKGLTYFKDAFINECLDEFTDLEYSAYRPVVLYLNGEYHGLFNLREKKNKDFISNVYNIPKGEIEMFDMNGGSTSDPCPDWDALMEYCRTHDLSAPQHYNWVNERVDIDNFIDYYIGHIFFSNTDWPKANVKVWRQKGGKFRHLFFDCDRGMNIGNVGFNMIEHVSGEDQWAMLRGDKKVDTRLIQSTVLIRALVKNQGFSQRFAMRYQDLLNTAFTVERLKRLFDQCAAKIDSEVANHIGYWKDKKNESTYQTNETLAQWKDNIEDSYRFLESRPSAARRNLLKKWDLGETVELSFTLDNSQMGSLKVNSIVFKESSFSGVYFSNLPLTLKAIPREGYRFDHWEGVEGVEGEDAEMVVKVGQVLSTVKPIFSKQ